MGMYGKIGKKNFKLSGLLAESCRSVGLLPVNGTLEFDRATATRVLTQMVISFEHGRQLLKGDSINGQLIYGLASDAKVLSALFDWIAFGKEDTLFFG